MSFADAFWKNVCRYARYYYLLLIAMTALTIANLFAFLLASPGSGGYVIAILNFAIFGTTAVGVALVVWYCQRT